MSTYGSGEVPPRGRCFRFACHHRREAWLFDATQSCYQLGPAFHGLLIDHDLSAVLVTPRPCLSTDPVHRILLSLSLPLCSACLPVCFFLCLICLSLSLSACLSVCLCLSLPPFLPHAQPSHQETSVRNRLHSRVLAFVRYVELVALRLAVQSRSPPPHVKCCSPPLSRHGTNRGRCR